MYFEIYNLSLNVNGESKYAVTYVAKNLDSKRAAEKQVISVRQEFEGSSRFEDTLMYIDISNLPHGTSNLKILVEDLIAKTAYERDFDFYIVKK